MKNPLSSQTKKTVRSAGKKSRSLSPLVSSPAVAKREIAGLSRSRKRLESSGTVAETDVRTSLI